MFTTLFIMLIITIVVTKWIAKGLTNPKTIQAVQHRQMMREQLAASNPSRRFSN